MSAFGSLKMNFYSKLKMIGPFGNIYPKQDLVNSLNSNEQKKNDLKFHANGEMCASLTTLITVKMYTCRVQK